MWNIFEDMAKIYAQSIAYGLEVLNQSTEYQRRV